MGADPFFTVAFGKDAREAFLAAREYALWESGHGGYTGTIAEKPGFVLFARPAVPDPPPLGPDRLYQPRLAADRSLLAEGEWRRPGGPGRAHGLERRVHLRPALLTRRAARAPVRDPPAVPRRPGVGLRNLLAGS